MSGRERLIDMLAHVGNMRIMRCGLEECADYMIANGVFAPPCKVGDTVYIIDNRDMLYIDPSVCSVVDDEVYEMGYGRTQSGELKWLFLVLETGEDFYDDDVGKTVFLTREEAEKSLSERSNHEREI